jgi:outer membrane protein OmpA-like peptidoglycan-associated protein
MFDTHYSRGQNKKDEAERPFWISYADLMTALMILFLVVMCVALFNVTHKISDKERLAAERDKELNQILNLLEANIKKCGDAKILRDRNVIDFGSQANFDFKSNKLTPTQEQYLRECVPNIVQVAEGDLGKKWIKRIVVEGYTDQKGGYLLNLNLSLQRSERVLCALLPKAASLSTTRAQPGKNPPIERVVTPEERKQIRQLFLVGGYSSNLAKASDEESRRVEMRLEFWGLEEAREAAPEDPPGIDADAICPLDMPPPYAQGPAGPRLNPAGTGNSTQSPSVPLVINPILGR